VGFSLSWKVARGRIQSFPETYSLVMIMEVGKDRLGLVGKVWVWSSEEEQTVLWAAA
jgi:hypothetical protein